MTESFAQPAMLKCSAENIKERAMYQMHWPQQPQLVSNIGISSQAMHQTEGK